MPFSPPRCRVARGSAIGSLTLAVTAACLPLIPDQSVVVLGRRFWSAASSACSWPCWRAPDLLVANRFARPVAPAAAATNGCRAKVAMNLAAPALFTVGGAILLADKRERTELGCRRVDRLDHRRRGLRLDRPGRNPALTRGNRRRTGVPMTVLFKNDFLDDFGQWPLVYPTPTVGPTSANCRRLLRQSGMVASTSTTRPSRVWPGVWPPRPTRHRPRISRVGPAGATCGRPRTTRPRITRCTAPRRSPSARRLRQAGRPARQGPGTRR